MFQTIVLLAIVTLAAAYVGLVIYRMIRGRGGSCACGREAVCPAARLMESLADHAEEKPPAGAPVTPTSPHTSGSSSPSGPSAPAGR